MADNLPFVYYERIDGTLCSGLFCKQCGKTPTFSACKPIYKKPSQLANRHPLILLFPIAYEVTAQCHGETFVGLYHKPVEITKKETT